MLRGKKALAEQIIPKQRQASASALRACAPAYSAD